ncbi:YraN family protein [bacterium]|nr:YraN family protein [bacterium]
MRSKPSSYKRGLFAEWWARMYLRLHGFRIVATRYVTGRYTGRAEIDIIARRGNLVVFVEVKCRPTIEAAWGAITPTQSRRLRAAAENYLARNRLKCDARFDVIIVIGRKIHWIRGAI